MQNFILPLLSLALGIALLEARAIEIRDRDKILLLGNTFIESAKKVFSNKPTDSCVLCKLDKIFYILLTH